MMAVHDMTHLECLLLEAMLRVVPEVVAACRRQWKATGHTGEPDRSTLVQCLLQQTGTKRFLRLCEQFPAYVPASPLMFLLFNSPNPGALVKKISLHAPHFHLTRRLELVEEGDGFFVVEDIVIGGVPPSPADDMFVCCTLKGVLREFGCSGISVTWEAVGSKELHDILRSINIQPLAIEKFTRWRFHWGDFVHPGYIKGMDEFLLEAIRPTSWNLTVSLTCRIQELLSIDLTRRPTMEEMADRLGISARTLQRKLETEGTSYSRIYTELRITMAEKLLRRTDMSLSEISYLSGFNDSAYFCREFKKKYNMTPKSYRQAS